MTAQSRLGERVFFDLSTRVKLRVGGTDRFRFLNGQLTNDIRKASETRSIEACVLNAKGKMEAHLFLHTSEESFLFDADPALQSSLQARLERYIIADDVTIEDLTAQVSIFHLLGDSVPKLSSVACVLSVDRFGLGGHDIWVDAAKHDETADELSKAFTFCNDNCAEAFRIEQGVPRWGRELTGEIIPVEANLEARCIDYEKGCYIGQEIISRMKMSGQRNKQLCGLISLDNVPLPGGARLTVAGKDVGWITSAIGSLNREIGLGYVKRGFNSVGSRLETSSAEHASIPVEIVYRPAI